MPAKRDSKGRWIGSGNPKGRTPGIPDRRAVYRDQLAQYGTQLIDKCIETALEGDTVALRIVMDRILPALKQSEPPTPFPLPEKASLAEQGAAIMAAAAEGTLGTDQASRLLAGISALHKVESEQNEIQMILQRLEALEGSS